MDNKEPAALNTSRSALEDYVVIGSAEVMCGKLTKPAKGLLRFRYVPRPIVILVVCGENTFRELSYSVPMNRMDEELKIRAHAVIPVWQAKAFQSYRNKSNNWLRMHGYAPLRTTLKERRYLNGDAFKRLKKYMKKHRGDKSPWVK